MLCFVLLLLAAPMKSIWSKFCRISKLGGAGYEFKAIVSVISLHSHSFIETCCNLGWLCTFDLSASIDFVVLLTSHVRSSSIDFFMS